MANFKEVLIKVKAFAFDIDGVLSSDCIPMHPSGEPMRTINIKDGFAPQKAVKLGFKIAIITGGNSNSILTRYQNLGIFDIYMGSSNKLPHFEHWLQKYNLNMNEVMYMGDDLPDLPVMQRVGIPVCPADAVWEIKAISKYISDKPGGRGCVRDVIEQVLRAQQLWGSELAW